MRKRIVILIVITLGLCLGGLTVYAINHPDKYSGKAERESVERWIAIQEELDELGDHPWAGEYYRGDGTGVNITLRLAPKLGYLFKWHGCLGLYDRNYGDITVQDGKIRLSFTYPNEQKGFQGIAEEFILIPWDERMYLIPENDMIKFCNSINSKREPRHDELGFHLLKCGDEKKPVSGKPDIPEKYKKYILDKPILANIISVDKPIIRKDITDKEYRIFPVTLNTGTESGLLEGMELHVIEPDDISESVTVTEVTEKQSKGVMQYFFDNDPLPQDTWKLSTIPWYRMDDDPTSEKEKEQNK